MDFFLQNFVAGLHQQVSEDDTSNHLGIDPVDDILNSNTIQTYLNNEIVVKQLKQSSTDLGPEVSTSGEDHISEGFCSDSLLADSQLQHSSEANVEISASEGDMSLSLHNNGSPDMIMASNYSVNILESLDDFIADEQHKKVCYFLFNSDHITNCVGVAPSKNNI
jgi:hypothetical protein